jgi:cysteine desulfuration protein SufE
MTHQAQLISDLLLIPDVQERLSAIVADASRVSLNENERLEERLVKGCQSRVWLAGKVEAGRLNLSCDAESPLVKGLVHLLCQVYNGQLLEDVRTDEPVLWEELGLAKMLSPTRLAGLAAVRARIREMAA